MACELICDTPLELVRVLPAIFCLDPEIKSLLLSQSGFLCSVLSFYPFSEGPLLRSQRSPLILASSPLYLWTLLLLLTIIIPLSFIRKSLCRDSTLLSRSRLCLLFLLHKVCTLPTSSSPSLSLDSCHWCFPAVSSYPDTRLSPLKTPLLPPSSSHGLHHLSHSSSHSLLTATHTPLLVLLLGCNPVSRSSLLVSRVA